jgi:hypothetical protein
VLGSALANTGEWIVPKDWTMTKLIDVLAELTEEERLELCDALVDDPRLRDLLEEIDDYLYLKEGEEPPVNLHGERELN